MFKGILRMNVYSVIEKLYLFFVLMYFLSSMHPWFLGEIELHQINALYTVVFLLCIICLKKRINFNIYKVLFCIFFLLSSYWGMDGAVLGPTFLVLPFLLIMLTSDVFFYVKFYDIVVNFFAYFLPISYFFFLLTLFGLPPISYISHSIYPTYGNYIFCIANSFYGIRFSSIFLEPGHLSMVLCVLIFAGGYNLRDKRILILSLMVFFTFSLAGFVLFALGFVVSFYMQGKLSIKNLLPFIFIFIILAIIAFEYNGGDNFFYEHFFSRLEFDEDKGFSGNNRVSNDVSDLFDKIVATPYFWFGFGMDAYSTLFNAGEDGSGVMIFILQKGFFSVLLVFISYHLLILTIKGKRKTCFCIIVFYFIMYLQRFYPYWSSFLLSFMCALAMIKKGELLNKYSLLLCKRKLYMR